MQLLDYIGDMSRRETLAKALSTSPDYLWQIAKGWNGRRAGPQLAQRIQEATQGIVTKESLRPDLWGESASDRPSRRKRRAA